MWAEVGTITATAIGVAGTLYLQLRATPSRVVSMARASLAAAEALESEVAALRTAWLEHRVQGEKLLEEITAASDTLERRRRKVHKEADRAERALNGGSISLDEFGAKTAELRARGWNV